MNKKITALITAGMMIISSGCSMKGEALEKQGDVTEKLQRSGLDFDFKIKPETFDIQIESNNKKDTIKGLDEVKKVSNLKNENNHYSWDYKEDGIHVEIGKEKDHLLVEMKANRPTEIDMPKVQGKSYYMPIGEGLDIPSNNKDWKEYFDEYEGSVNEILTMPFMVSQRDNFDIMYILEEPYNTDISVDTKDLIKWKLSHQFVPVNKEKSYKFRIYVTKHNPVHAAKIYRDFVKSEGKFVSFEEKMSKNPNMKKLLGAPHMYIWGREVLKADDIKWPKFVQELKNGQFEWLIKYWSKKQGDYKEGLNVLSEIEKEGFVTKYQKNIVIRLFNTMMSEQDLKSTKGQDGLPTYRDYKANKEFFKEKLKNCSIPSEKWGDGVSIPLLKEMKNFGIEKAWLGFSDWIPGYINEEYVNYANKEGFLVGPYDSYHSIHKDINKDWLTASFKDRELFESSTIKNRKGEYIKGFQGVGRKLNPVFSIEAVKDRLDEITKTPVKFNSWFIDCDGAGELYDDYTKGHETTQREDMQARLKRMEIIRDQYNMVIGTEGGNDYSASTVAFAHGLETPVLKWADKDLYSDKNSPYYLGKYYTAGTGVPDCFGMETKMKPIYSKTILNPIYKLPLYKLVYNDSVITTHHWSHGSLKFSDIEKQRSMTELLYNVPPLYHIDTESWKKDKEKIVNHTKIFSKLHEKALLQEMTDFEYLNEEKTVQKTVYGKDIYVIVNFGKSEFKYENEVLKENEALIKIENEKIKVSE